MELDRNGLAFVHVNRYTQDMNRFFDYRSMPRPFYTIAAILHGAADFTEDGRTSHVEDGDCIFVPLHSCYQSLWSGNPCTEMLSCHFLLPASCSPIQNRRFFVQKLPNSEKVFALVQKLFVIQEDAQKLFDVLETFYAICSQTFPQLDSQPAPALSPRIQTAVSFIEAHYREGFSIRDVAAQCGLSESHLYSRFQKEVGLSPIAYKHCLAVTAAEQLLTAHDHLTIEEISERAGFESSTYFRRVFKSMTGCSPKAYRQRQNGL